MRLGRFELALLLLAGCAAPPGSAGNERLRAQPSAVSGGVYVLQPSLDPEQLATQLGDPTLEALVGMRLALADESLRAISAPPPGAPPGPPAEQAADAQAVADHLAAELAALAEQQRRRVTTE